MRSLSNIIERFSKMELGGFSAQKLYSPPYRSTLTLDEIKALKPRLAAVNILLYPKAGKWFFPLIVRSKQDNDRHSGQISLPGGKFESEDKDFKTTAIRETYEELGVEKKSMKIIKSLSPIHIEPSNFYVYTYVSWVKSRPKFKLQKKEVEELIEMPLSSIFNLPSIPELKVLPETKGVAVPVINYNGYIVWGATSMILSEFRDLMKKV